MMIIDVQPKAANATKCDTHVFVSDLEELGIYDAQHRTQEFLLDIGTASTRQEFAKVILESLGRDKASCINIVPEWMGLEQTLVAGHHVVYRNGDIPHHLRFKMTLESYSLELLKEAANAVQDGIREGCIMKWFYDLIEIEDECEK